MLFLAVELRRPFTAEANFVQPVDRGERRNERGQRHQWQRPGLIAEQRQHDAVNIGGQLPVASVRAANYAAARAQPGKKFLGRSRTSNQNDATATSPGTSVQRKTFRYE